MAPESDIVALIETVVPSRGVEVRDGYVYVQDPEPIAAEVLDGSVKPKDVSKHGFRLGRVDARLLEAFVNFQEDDDKEGEDEGLTKFVYRYGLLGVCADGEPHNHRPGCEAERVEWFEGGEDDEGPPSLWEAPKNRREVGIREPVDAWHRYRDRAEALLLIAASLRGKPVAQRGRVRGAWRTLIDGVGVHRTLIDGVGVHGYPTIERLMRNRAIAVAMYSENLNDWLRAAPLSLSMVWDTNEDRAEAGLRGTLLSVLGYQILAATNRAMLLAFCAGCGRLFEPHPRIPQARGKYCTLCRSKNVSGRIRGQQFREQQREIRRLAEADVPIDEIARRMNKTPEKIRKWLGAKK